MTPPRKVQTILELWLVELKAEGMPRQVCTMFNEREADERCRQLNRIVPGSATKLGPYKLID